MRVFTGQRFRAGVLSLAALSPVAASRLGSFCAATRFVEELAYHLLGTFVFAFAEVVETDSSLCIDKVVRGPVLIRERAPDRELVVDRNRESEAEVMRGALDVVDLALEGKLR
jgi:hypothetical protein